MARITSTISLFLSVFSVASAAIPSMGHKTTEVARKKLSSSAYLINPRKGTTVKTTAFTAYIAEQPKFKALSTADVQFAYADILLNPGGTFPKHYHPRAAEILTVTAGAARVTFIMENGRKVINLVGWYKATVIPQGLPHVIKCMSKTRCRMVASLNSADPGTVFI